MVDHFQSLTTLFTDAATLAEKMDRPLRRAGRVAGASSGWGGDVLRLCRFQEQGFETGVGGFVQNLAA